MTTVDLYPSIERNLHLHSDDPIHSRPTSTATHSHSLNHQKQRYIPPAVPSPPQSSCIQRLPPQTSLEKEHPEVYVYRPIFEMATEDSQWIFSEAELANSPSILDGLSPADERYRRAKGVNFLYQAGIMLKLPQLTIATASVFFHRFFMRVSMNAEKDNGGVHHYNIGATALFLATKTEENCRKTPDIVCAIARIAQKNTSMIIDENVKEYWRWRDAIMKYEEIMLEKLTFDVVLTSPYNLLYYYLKDIGLANNKELRNIAWAVLNDSFMTTICLTTKPKEIACVAIYYGAKFGGTKVPDVHGRAWWEHLGANMTKVVQAAHVLNKFYQENPLKKSHQPFAQTPSSIGGDDLEKTRARSERRASGDSTSSQAAPHSQRTQNGAQGDHPTNGTVERRLSQPKEAIDSNVKPETSNTVAANENSESLTSQASLRDQNSSGSTDAALKEAANDLSVHVEIQQANGIDAISEPKISAKRKLVEDTEEPAAKKPKIDSDNSKAPAPVPEPAKVNVAVRPTTLPPKPATLPPKPATLPPKPVAPVGLIPASSTAEPMPSSLPTDLLATPATLPVKPSKEKELVQ